MNARGTTPQPQNSGNSKPHPQTRLAKVAVAVGFCAYGAAELWGRTVFGVVVVLAAVTIGAAVVDLRRLKPIRPETGYLSFLAIIAAAMGLLIAYVSKSPIL